MSVSIKPITLDDIRELYPLCNDRDVCWMSGGGLTYPMTFDEFKGKKTIALSNNEKDMQSYLISYCGKAAGSIGYFKRQQDKPFEVGYWIGKEFWGKGITSEALTQFLDLVAKGNIVDLLVATALVDNQASHKILNNAGFNRTAEATIDSPSRKMQVDVIHYEMQISKTLAIKN